MRQIPCSICDCEIAPENVEGQFLCSHCAEVYTDICACCENRIRADSNSGSIELPLCEDCYERHYVSCERCGRIIHNDEVCCADDDEDYPLELVS